MTNRQELIERLKSNRTAWKWLSDDEKDILVKNKDKVIALNYQGGWNERVTSLGGDVVCVYRIHESYTEEAERPELPIKYTNADLLECSDKLNEVIDCINWLYDKVERIEK